MKLYLLILFFSVGQASCQPQTLLLRENTNLTFLYKTNFDTSSYNQGKHIEIKQVLPKTDELIPMSIDDRDIISRSGYDRKDEIKILAEYLSFRGDTDISNKRYHFKAAYYMIRPEGIKGFTIQIESLYSFTRMLTIGYPPIKPMLISRTTGEELNTNSKVVSEVYDIYVKWYKENKKTDFKNITLPLTGSPYCWLGEDNGMEPYLKKSL
jgi:hypothetical protein